MAHDPETSTNNFGNTVFLLSMEEGNVVTVPLLSANSGGVCSMDSIKSPCKSDTNKETLARIMGVETAAAVVLSAFLVAFEDI